MRKVLFLVLCLVAFMLFVLSLFLFRLELVKQYDRPGNVKIPDSIKNELIINTANLSEVEIINHCVGVTVNLLEFSFKQDPLFKHSVSKAHCVTYAKVCSSLCNEAFQANNIEAKAKPVVGYVECFGINLCKWYSSLNTKHKNYFKDHDFVEIQGSNYAIYVDPCLKDLIGSDFKCIHYK